MTYDVRFSLKRFSMLCLIHKFGSLSVRELIMLGLVSRLNRSENSPLNLMVTKGLIRYEIHDEMFIGFSNRKEKKYMLTLAGYEVLIDAISVGAKSYFVPIFCKRVEIDLEFMAGLAAVKEKITTENPSILAASPDRMVPLHAQEIQSPSAQGLEN